MSAQKKVSETAMLLVIVGIVVFGAGQLALPLFGMAVSVGITYSGIALAAMGLMEQTAHRRHLELMKTLVDSRKADTNQSGTTK